MSTTIAIQITPQGVLIPRTAIHNWGEIEAVREKDRIIIQPKSPPPAQGQEVITQALREAGLLYEPQARPEIPRVSAKSTRHRTDRLHAQIVAEMKAAGLIEDLPWTQPPEVSPEERAYLAKRLSHGKPLSEIIIEDREDRA